MRLTININLAFLNKAVGSFQHWPALYQEQCKLASQQSVDRVVSVWMVCQPKQYSMLYCIFFYSHYSLFFKDEIPERVKNRCSVYWHEAFSLCSTVFVEMWVIWLPVKQDASSSHQAVNMQSEAAVMSHKMTFTAAHLCQLHTVLLNSAPVVHNEWAHLVAPYAYMCNRATLKHGGDTVLL